MCECRPTMSTSERYWAERPYAGQKALIIGVANERSLAWAKIGRAHV